MNQRKAMEGLINKKGGSITICVEVFEINRVSQGTTGFCCYRLGVDKLLLKYFSCYITVNGMCLHRFGVTGELDSLGE